MWSIFLTSFLVLFLVPASVQSINDVVSFDLKIQDNLRRHHTNLYRTRQLVLRRGESISFTMGLRNDYNSTGDKVRLEFSFDPETFVYIPLETSSNPTGWTARVTNVNGNKVSGEFFVPADIAIGSWRFSLTIKEAGTNTVRQYIIREVIYIIFNPWNQDDSVYLDGEDARQEYAMNEAGIIYMGSNYNHGHSYRRWIYGQFHENVLSTMIYLLDSKRMTSKDRADVVRVSREVSALVNANDGDNGLLVGNWSGNYYGGIAPWSWDNSALVFREYALNGMRPVKFAQCWVFGGVLTTALRTLGIPARTITNYGSAHDTDRSFTVDKYVTGSGEKLDSDSIWNFHVWSEAWMDRPDLPVGYGGWQALDSTPQEPSGGFYQLGPASLAAVKQGLVDYAYDTSFVYSEVNAEQVVWILDGRARFQWTKSQVQRGNFGKTIITKKSGSFDGYESIYSLYKYPEGSAEARRARAEAAQRGGLSPLLEPFRR